MIVARFMGTGSFLIIYSNGRTKDIFCNARLPRLFLAKHGYFSLKNKETLK
jgi:hypothetical protein